ncbi:hypothetical protein C8J57DRAFT_1721360 [Mycena rebaudengoi]|nr:hypothetical protein C8J57DRAFT_1721360 [Mycena rebaudengoi]
MQEYSVNRQTKTTREVPGAPRRTHHPPCPITDSRPPCADRSGTCGGSGHQRAARCSVSDRPASIESSSHIALPYLTASSAIPRLRPAHHTACRWEGGISTLRSYTPNSVSVAIAYRPSPPSTSSAASRSSSHPPSPPRAPPLRLRTRPHEQEPEAAADNVG